MTITSTQSLKLHEALALVRSMNLMDKIEAVHHWNSAAERFQNIVNYKGPETGLRQSKSFEQSNCFNDYLFVHDPVVSENSDGLKLSHFSPLTPPNPSVTPTNNINPTSESSQEQQDCPVVETYDDSTFFSPNTIDETNQISSESNDSDTRSLNSTVDDQSIPEKSLNSQNQSTHTGLYSQERNAQKPTNS